jgi:hypothetical protein
MNEEWIRLVDTRLQNLETRSAVSEVHQAVVEKRLAAIEDTLKWLVRLIIGTLVLAAVAYAVQGGLQTP